MAKTLVDEPPPPTLNEPPNIGRIAPARTVVCTVLNKNSCAIYNTPIFTTVPDAPTVPNFKKRREEMRRINEAVRILILNGDAILVNTLPQGMRLHQHLLWRDLLQALIVAIAR